LEPVWPTSRRLFARLDYRPAAGREWFFEQSNGNGRLMSPFAVRLAETAPNLGTSSRPDFRMVAQALWNAPSRSDTKKHSVPTSLTQRRGSEGRGRKIRALANPVPQQIKICEVCGAEGVRNRYCRSCAVEASRETMAKVALMGRAKPKRKKAKSHISKMVSEHAVANSWWDPTTLPNLAE